MIKGIGPVYASKLIKAFKENIFTVIETTPEHLLLISGIGPFRAEKITKSWTDQKTIRDIMLFSHSHGVSTAKAVRIYKTYGDKAIELIRENPYRLAQDIYGIGFLSADKIAFRLGIEKSSILRARAGISYALSKGLDDGHSGRPTPTLLSSCQKLLESEPSIISQALELELSQWTVVKDTPKGTKYVFLAGLYQG